MAEKNSQSNLKKSIKATGAEISPCRSVLSELYVDLMGSLVPGLFTVILGAAILFLTVATIYSMKTTSSLTSLISTLFGKQQALLAEIHSEIAVITLVSAYIIGTAFFRQDPKKPDRTSALFGWMNSTKEDRRGWAVQPVSERKKEIKRKYRIWHFAFALAYPGYYTKAFDLNVQFPYSHIKCYLAVRGLDHLLPYISWCPSEEEFNRKSKFYRTKMLINTLKVQLQSFVPELCRDIVRNEAHVRLATSVWYACRCLFWLAVVCIIVLLTTFHFSEITRPGFEMMYPPLVLIALVAVLCIIMMYQLTKCIHYMRVREVLYVLETVHLGQRINKNFQIEELIKKSGEHACNECKNIWPRKLSESGTVNE